MRIQMLPLALVMLVLTSHTMLPNATAWAQATAKPSAKPAAKSDAKPAADPVVYTYTGDAAPPIGFVKIPMKAKGAIRLAAYNVENLFDAKDDPTLSGEFDDLPMATDQTRLQNLAATITALDADVLAIEEIESEECLTWFRDTYLKSAGYTHLASKDVGYYRGVEQAVLSRYPIEKIEIYPEMKLLDAADRIPADATERKKQGWAPVAKLEKPGFQRSPLAVTIRMPDGSALTLLVVHFKSGGAKYAYQRELEALSVVTLIDAVRAKDKNAQIAVVGDFNATPMQHTAKLLRDKQLGGLISAYEARPAADRMKVGDQIDSDDDANDGDGAPARKASPAQSEKPAKPAKTKRSPEQIAVAAKYLTHSFVPDGAKAKPMQRSIDYILLSPSLYAKAAKDGYFVFSTPKPLTSNTERPSGYASDHNPIAVDFMLGVKQADAKPQATSPSAPVTKPAGN